MYWCAMPIEDVDYLLQTSVEESTTLFIDSGSRDRTHYTTPSEYVIDLEEPIRDVFGMDILDAVMPNTIYNVSAENNKVRWCTIDTVASLIDTNDDTVLSSEMFKLGYGSPWNAWMSDTSVTFDIVVLDTNTNNTLISNPGSTGSSSSTIKYIVLCEKRLAVGFSLVSTTNNINIATTIEFAGAFYYAIDAAGSAAIALAKSASATGTGFALVRSGTSTPPLMWPGRVGTYDIVTYDQITLHGGRVQMQDVCKLNKQISRLRVTLCTALVETGFYNRVTSLQTAMQTAFDESDIGGVISIESTSSSGIDRQNIFKFTTDVGNRLILCASSSSMRGILGFDIVPLNASPSSYGIVTSGNASQPMYSSVIVKGIQNLVAPGLINLIGVQYVTLRCKEIEQHMGNVGKYGKFSTGIGVFKLLGSNEVAQLRFDYISLIRKPLHPIGRLRRLTLRFELPNGELFDFKGINHQLLVSVNYYRPDPRRRRMLSKTQNSEFPTSVLNPDYDPDFMRYMQRRDAHAALTIDDLGFAEGNEMMDDEHKYYEDEEDDDEDDADVDDDLNRYVFGKPPPPKIGRRRRQQQQRDFVRFDTVQQNRVAAIERELLGPFRS